MAESDDLAASPAVQLDAEEATPVPLLRPRDGTPDPIATADQLAETIARFGRGSGPVALDAERASGYRYSQRAYLVQLRRDGAGTALIDPLPFAAADELLRPADPPRDGALSALDAALADAEWVLHAASQDLPCLAELGMRPRKLFDTELAGRLAGFDRVGLGAMVERVLGFSLEKTHSAADWSTRPLPPEWLVYAALDVELLVALRDALADLLDQQGKLAWALEEFAALAVRPPNPPRAEPWRRTSGVHKVRSQRGLARVRALWQTRDRLARERDIAPGRVLPDAAIISAAIADPADVRGLLALPVFSGRANRRLVDVWMTALEEARASTDLPPTSAAPEGPPPPNRWADKNPDAAGRLTAARAVMAELSAEHNIPVENLLTPDLVRRLAWDPPQPLTGDAVGEVLRGQGAREWQILLAADRLAAALTT
ncbi:HRDC domain-containing protein [Fodinicola acaciae]|uniref:HRDC domain-containing protein n=1 Tax=Fodinicola acaciae TaxID=2681555 RepID=UPI001C9E311C|nr:HRDC domain-containing protein [Fodinicola acaciae]